MTATTAEPTEQGPASAVASTYSAISAPAPAPVLAPYLGLFTSVLCALGGAWLLLAPYALDLRRGAAKLPRAAAVDLETGAAIVAVASLSTILFAAALFSRLRPHAASAAANSGSALREMLTPLIAAPFVLGDQARGAVWTAATRTDVAAGAAVAGIAILGLFGYLAAAVTWLARYGRWQ